jgi:hypothetical protein
MLTELEFSPELLAAWRKAERAFDRDPEADETREAMAEFDRLIGLKPWEWSPLEVDDGPSPYPPGTSGHETWAPAQELRRALWRASKRRSAAR